MAKTSKPKAPKTPGAPKAPKPVERPLPTPAPGGLPVNPTPVGPAGTPNRPA